MMTTMPPLSGLRALIVEDEALVAMLLEDLLAELGPQVVCVAGSVAQALALLAADDPGIDVALLDLNLRGEPVYAVADRLQALGVPFVFCSGYGAQGVEAAYSHVPTLNKPVDLEVMEQTIAAAVALAVQTRPAK
jgi:CheY-like chemotaxis protein